MRTLVLLQRFEGHLTAVGPGLLAVELEQQGETLGLGDVDPSLGRGGRRSTAFAVIFVIEEEEQ